MADEFDMTRMVSIRAGGSTHTRTAEQWLNLSRAAMTATAHPEQPLVQQEPRVCRMGAGYCPKPVATFGEPHECGLPLGHGGLHRCIRCEMEFNADSVYLAPSEQPKESAPLQGTAHEAPSGVDNLQADLSQPSACAYPLCNCPIAWQGELPVPETVCPRALIQSGATLAEIVETIRAAERAQLPIEPEDAIHREIWRDEVRDEPPVEGPEQVAPGCCIDGSPCTIDRCAKCPERDKRGQFAEWLETYKPGAGRVFDRGDMAATWYAAIRVATAYFAAPVAPRVEQPQESVLVSEILEEIAHIEENGARVCELPGMFDEGRCRLLCAMYLRGFIESRRLGDVLARARLSGETKA